MPRLGVQKFRVRPFQLLTIFACMSAFEHFEARAKWPASFPFSVPLTRSPRSGSECCRERVFCKRTLQCCSHNTAPLYIVVPIARVLVRPCVCVPPLDHALFALLSLAPSLTLLHCFNIRIYCHPMFSHTFCSTLFVMTRSVDSPFAHRRRNRQSFHYNSASC